MLPFSWHGLFKYCDVMILLVNVCHCAGYYAQNITLPWQYHDITITHSMRKEATAFQKDGI